MAGSGLARRRGAAKTLADLKSELARIKVDAESLLDRQSAVAARMDSLGRQ
jgi:hypothetical protein